MNYLRRNADRLLRSLIPCLMIFNHTITAKSPPSNALTPRYITYYFSDDSPLSSAVGSPYTHLILAFITATVNDQNIIELHTNERLDPAWDDISELQANGKKVLISFGGGVIQSADYAPLAGRETELAKLLADFVRSRGLDGIDIDYEASDTFHTVRPRGVINGRKFLIGV